MNQIQPGEELINIDGVLQLIQNAPNKAAAKALLSWLQEKCPEDLREAELRLLQGRPNIKITTYQKEK